MIIFVCQSVVFSIDLSVSPLYFLSISIYVISTLYTLQLEIIEIDRIIDRRHFALRILEIVIEELFDLCDKVRLLYLSELR